MSFVTSSRDVATGLITLTQIDGQNLRSLTLAPALSATLRPEHSPDEVWVVVMAEPTLILRDETDTLGRP